MVHTGREALLRFTTSQISLALVGICNLMNQLEFDFVFYPQPHSLCGATAKSPFPNMIISHKTADYRGAHSRRLCVQPPAPVTLSSRWKLTTVLLQLLEADIK